MNSPSIRWRKPAPYSTDEVLKRVRRRLAGRVQEAYLFGSYAREEAHGDSDVDLIIVSESSRPEPERFKDFLDLYQDFKALDLVVYSPDEWNSLQEAPNSLISATHESWRPVFGTE